MSPVLRSTERRRALVRLAGLGCLLAAGPLAAQGGTLTPVPDTPAAPPLVLPDSDGKPVDLAAYRGRLVLVNFWATWCPPCRREFPSLSRVQKLFRPAELAVLAVNVGEDAETIFSFTGASDVAVLLDRDSTAMRRWPVKGLPTTFIVDRQGRLALRAVGGREFDDPAIVARLRALLKNT
ncbi:MAG: TlpA family protein disulfide reductase [Rhodocyclales bacterium]|nr:TlpA family protein disulfide reductase [Rhodocyclales bacterium]